MRRVLDILLRNFIQTGILTVTFSDGSSRRYIGQNPGDEAALEITTLKAEHAIALNPALSFGEEYMNGHVLPKNCSLRTLLHVLMQNLQNHTLVSNEIGAHLRQLMRLMQPLNSLRRSRRNVAHHYDLDGRLYSLFLDRDLQYSCAYFEREDMTLEEAQEAKKRHIAAKLCLERPGLEVLDIGCGWGGMALTLARDYGARVTGITLSVEQLSVARQRAEAAGLEDRVHFELMDYRTCKRHFDRIVSVGMFEHVGLKYYETFFLDIKRCLKPDGIALIHSIGRMDGPATTNPWIAKYIFPGGYSPALSEVFAVVEKTGLWVTDCEILRLHYARTIEEWYRRFSQNREKIRALYDDRFVRMFELYLLASEQAFRVQGHMNFQIQLTPDINAVPFTRDYMFSRKGG
ncbi:cyclopropane-fatty-acyl-phospholipid synthase [Acetobacteraceae bacterium ESL0709]|nr:cyclopropane-fatty-acyl-phospholipid synthase [Acetobacteraceae bacterium ESL0697]MDF7678601.1 cyclopropane-fatty-acyl-phospholipid synthase [Acetobacteraceae bacterium ESL0709]